MRERVEKYGVKRSSNSRYETSEYKRYSPIFRHFSLALGDTLSPPSVTVFTIIVSGAKVTKKHALTKAASI